MSSGWGGFIKMVMWLRSHCFAVLVSIPCLSGPILSDRTKDTKTTFCGLNKIFLTSKNDISPPSSQPPQLLLWMTERLFGLLPALSSQKNHTQWWGHHCQGEKFCEGVRCQSSQSDDCWCSLLGTNISPPKGTFEDDFPFQKLGDMLIPCTVTTMGFDDDTHVRKHPILGSSSRVHYIAPWCKQRWKIMKRHLKFAKGSLEVLPLLIIFCRKKVDSTSFCGESMPNLL